MFNIYFFNSLWVYLFSFTQAVYILYRIMTAFWELFYVCIPDAYYFVFEAGFERWITDLLLQPHRCLITSSVTLTVFLISVCSRWCGSAGVCVCRWKPATCTVTWSAAGWASDPVSSFPECCSCLRMVCWARICCRRSSCCPAQMWSRSCARCARDTCPGSPTPSRRPGSQVRLIKTVLLLFTCGIIQMDSNFKISSYLFSNHSHFN